MKIEKTSVNFFNFLSAAIILILTFTLAGNLSVINLAAAATGQEMQPVNQVIGNPGGQDFTSAANHTISRVVHVKIIREQDDIPDLMEFFFGPEREDEPDPQEGMGSGVVITDDGYIVTNHHVIAEADEIEVTLHDQRIYSAEMIGGDPNTDIAVLKINETGLDYISFGNSGDLEIGQWVLAVGNPFGLTSSVTAGIISAKGRALGALQGSEMPIESFLQTDAAVNVGNSGGALVNLDGELVGVPTLIISPTRTHTGTAFAVPAILVERVVEDIIEYGEVRRGILGVSISEVTPEVAQERRLDEIKGVLIEGTIDGSAADQAGIMRKDVIIEVNGNEVNSSSELQIEISRHHPGDNVNLLLIRNGSRREVTARLLDMEEHRELVVKHEETLLGATFKRAPEELAEKFGLPGGVQVTEVGPGELQEAGVNEGFIIVGINNMLVGDPAHIMQLLEDFSGNVVMQGIYPDGTTANYNFTL